MRNDRPINNNNIQRAIQQFHQLCEFYDLVGCCTFADKEEMGFYYHMTSTWNGIVDDDATPLGFRIRVIEKDLGRERAQEFAEGTVWTFAALRNFGKQTMIWGNDLLDVLRGLKWDLHIPELKVPRLGAHNFTKKGRK
jgi:hypothetical protein